MSAGIRNIMIEQGASTGKDTFFGGKIDVAPERVNGLRYIGSGAYIPGVPARDLTPAEALEFTDLIMAQQLVSGVALYETVFESPQRATEE
jgi:hypothetical protein